MENIIVLSGEQLEDVIYKTVSRCLEEKHIGNYVENRRKKASSIVTSYADGYISRIQLYGGLKILAC